MSECACGCGSEAQTGNFLPGHDENVRAAVMYILAGTSDHLAQQFRIGPGRRNAQLLCRDARRGIQPEPSQLERDIRHRLDEASRTA